MMVLDIFKRSPQRNAKALVRRQATDLLNLTMRAARNPGLYGPKAAPDDFSGRFDLVALMAALVSLRLTELGEPAAALNQAFVNALFKSFDDALREDGVGDLTVPKKMQRLAEGFYGRAAAYRKAFAALDAGDTEGRAALEDALRRNVLRSEPAREAFVTPLADHSLATRAILSKADLSDLSAGSIVWPDMAPVHAPV